MKSFQDCVQEIVSFFSDDYTAEFGKSFHMVNVTNTIVYTVFSGEGNKYFYQYLSRKAPKIIPYGEFLISLLHEVGHLENEDLWRKEYGARSIVNLIGRVNMKLANHIYFRLYNERVATNWAIDFILSNPEICRVWSKKLKESFIENFPHYPLTYT